VYKKTKQNKIKCEPIHFIGLKHISACSMASCELPMDMSRLHMIH
jgi:hypothetical protein